MIVLIIIVSIICCANNIRETFKNNRDFQIFCMQIQNKLDFQDYCVARVGTKNINDLNMSNETKIKVAEDYLKGIEHMKELARMNKIVINREPLYGKLAKNNSNINNFTNFRDYL